MRGFERHCMFYIGKLLFIISAFKAKVIFVLEKIKAEILDISVEEKWQVSKTFQ